MDDSLASSMLVMTLPPTEEGCGGGAKEEAEAGEWIILEDQGGSAEGEERGDAPLPSSSPLASLYPSLPHVRQEQQEADKCSSRRPSSDR